jgi:RNA 3'-terminal phosphate cyclase
VTYILESLGFGKFEGNTLGSSVVRYIPRNYSVQQSIDSLGIQRIEKDVGSAGSISLILQAIFPIFCFQPNPTLLTLKGGTNVSFSPPLDHAEHVLLPLLSRMGILAQILPHYRRGFYPVGGGKVQISIQGNSTLLQPIQLIDQGKVVSITGVVYGNCDLEEPQLNLVNLINDELRQYLHSLASRELLSSEFRGVHVQLSTSQDEEQSAARETKLKSNDTDKGKEPVKPQINQKKRKKKCTNHSLGAQIAIATDTGCVLSANYLVCERDEDIFQSSPPFIVSELMQQISHQVDTGSCVDEHTADQLLIFMALAAGDRDQGPFESKLLCEPFVEGKSSQHLETAVYLLNELLGPRGCHLHLETTSDTGCRLITCRGIGYSS